MISPNNASSELLAFSSSGTYISHWKLSHITYIVLAKTDLNFVSKSYHHKGTQKNTCNQIEIESQESLKSRLVEYEHFIKDLNCKVVA